MSRFRFIFIAIFFLLLTYSVGNAQDTSFHLPKTITEKRLSSILEFSSKNKLGQKFFNYQIGHHYDVDAAKKYSYLFTKQLQNSWKKAEKGADPIDMDVLTCNDFFSSLPKELVYRTTKSTETEVLIETSYKNESQKTPSVAGPDIYRLVKVGHSWKIDGISCGDTYTYNMP